MGKKSRRTTNRNKPKDIPGAVASPPVAVPRQVAASGASQDSNKSTFMQLCVSNDWEGALELESEMSVIEMLRGEGQPLSKHPCTSESY